MERPSADPPRGLICPLVTPLKGSHVDTASLQRLLEHTLGDVNAILLNGPVWGEGLALSTQARLTLAEAALDTVRGRCPVLISVTGHTPKETNLTLSELDHLVDRYNYPGPVFWVDAPVCYHSNRNLPQFYKALTLGTPFEFILYNHPVLVRGFKKSIYHKNIRTSVVKKLSENNRIIGLIFTGTMKRCLDYQQAVRYHQRFRIYDGDEKKFLDRPSSSGVLAGGSNFLPKVWREITCSSLNLYDSQQAGSDHIYRLLESGEMLRKFYNLYCEKPAMTVKYILHALGIIADARTVESKEGVSKSQVEHINRLFREYDVI